MLSNAEWLADLYERLTYNEGYMLACYRDAGGVPTIGVGFNLQRPDAGAILSACGSSLEAILNGAYLTPAQARAILIVTAAQAIKDARASLDSSHFDLLSDARRAAITDIVFNIGLTSWKAFTTCIGYIDSGVHELINGSQTIGHDLMEWAAEDLLATPYASQVGARARRNAEMLRTSSYVDKAAFS